MAASPQKRPSPSNDNVSPPRKRQRTAALLPLVEEPLRAPPAAPPQTQRFSETDSRTPSHDEQARHGLRRSIVLALEHVGFDSASPEAVESLTFMTETYLESLIKDTQLLAHASRRAQPSPVDFDLSLGRFNLRTSALKPHLRNPVAKTKLRPEYFDPLVGEAGAAPELPLIGVELSGKTEKELRAYIPKEFPDFPSLHTYRATPIDVDSVTVRGTGLRYDDGTVVKTGGRLDQLSAEGPRGNPKKIREAAAREAKQAEEALRGLVRASKINALKEVRATAVRNPQSRERYDLWEAAMRELVDDSTKGKSKTAADPGASRLEIADHSMIVNAERAFYRRGLQRSGKRSAPERVMGNG